MKRYLWLGILLNAMFITGLLHAQKASSITWEEEIKSSKWLKRYPLGSAGEFHYIFDLDKKTTKFSQYNDQHQLINQYTATTRYEKKPIIYQQILNTKSKNYLIGSCGHKKKDMVYWFKREIHPDGTLAEETEKFAEMPYDFSIFLKSETKLTNDKYLIERSPDKTKVLIGDGDKLFYKRDENQMYQVQVFDENLSKIASHKIEIDIKDKRFIVTNAFVNNEGEVFLSGSEMNKSLLFRHAKNVFIAKVNTDGTQKVIQLQKEGFNFKTARVIRAENGQIAVAGMFYTELENKKELYGNYMITIDDDGNIINEQLIEELSDIKDVKKRIRSVSTSGPKIRSLKLFLHLNDVYVDVQKKEYILIHEVRYAGSKHGTDRLIIYNIGFDGQLKWRKLLEKSFNHEPRNVSPAFFRGYKPKPSDDKYASNTVPYRAYYSHKYDYESSFVSAVKDNQLYLVYNDKKTLEELKQYDFKGKTLAVYSHIQAIDLNNGKETLNEVFYHTERGNKRAFITGKAVNIGEGKITFITDSFFKNRAGVLHF